MTEESPAASGVQLNAPIGGWRTAIVRELSHPTSRTVLLRLDVENRVDHLPGQHYVIRLRADDGYVAQRSYSVSSAPSDPLLELYVERLDDGEVSTFLADGVEIGDELEVRGPIGGWFTWDGASPALGIGGGTGVVPLIAMLRHARHLGRTDRLSLAVSARTLDELPYADELTAAAATIAISRAGYQQRPPGRLTRDELARLTSDSQLQAEGTAYICGSSRFAEATSQLLAELGWPVDRVRIERFGPSSGA